MRVYLTFDPTKPARDARKEALRELIAAEMSRVMEADAPLMADRAAFLANVAPRYPATPDAIYRVGCSGGSCWPYTEYTLMLMAEQSAIPYDRTVTEEAPCPICGKCHDRLWTIDRRPRAPFGRFPVVAIAGEEIPIDPTIPTTVCKLPRDAAPVTPEAAAPLWHSTAHYFGSTFDAGQALRETIAALNAGQPAPDNGWTLIEP